MQIKSIQKHLAPFHHLEKSDGIHYFFSDLPHESSGGSIYVYSFRDYSLARWLQEYESYKAELRE